VCPSWAYKQDYCIFRVFFQTCKAIWLCTLRYHIIIFDRFCWWLSFPRAVYPDILCIIRCLQSPVRKSNNVRDLYEFPDFWPPNSPDLNIVDYKIWDSESTRKKAQGVNDLRLYLIDMWVKVEQSVIDHCTVAQTSLCLHSCRRKKHFEYLPWHKLIVMN